MKIAILVSKYTQNASILTCFLKISSREIPHSKRVSKIIVFLYKMVIFEKKKSDKKILTKLHRFKKISGGSMPPNPPSNKHGFAMRHANSQI